VDEDVRKAEEAAAAANAIKSECEEALAEAIPILVRSKHWVKHGFILV
jgi:dynein heavy chain